MCKCGRASAGSSEQVRLRAGAGWRCAQILLMAAGFFHCAACAAQALPNTIQAHQARAASLHNLAKFVEWPDGPAGTGGPLVVAVFGADPVGPVLERLVWGGTVNGRPLVVRYAHRVEELLPCHVLFIGSSDRKRLGEILRAVGNASVLTVSDAEEFLQLGGAVRFTVEESTVRFRINLEAARRAGLQISSKLLSLAKAVRN